jgi:hypothetical protein
MALDISQAGRLGRQRLIARRGVASDEMLTAHVKVVLIVLVALCPTTLFP